MNESMEKTTLDKGQRIKALREHHLPVFDYLGLERAYYAPKMFYTPSGKDELHVSFFISELQRGQDIFTEMVDRGYNSEDVTRTLYKWPFNPEWEHAYEKTSTEPTRILIPVSKLVKVDPERAIPSTNEELPDGCSEDDCDITSMTMKDFAAIMWKEPVSDKLWLNALIKGKGR